MADGVNRNPVLQGYAGDHGSIFRRRIHVTACTAISEENFRQPIGAGEIADGRGVAVRSTLETECD